MHKFRKVPRSGPALAAVLVVLALLAGLTMLAACGSKTETHSAGSGAASSATAGADTPTSLASGSSPLVATGRPKIVDLGSTSCLPCRMMVPELAALAREYAGSLDVVVVDVDKNPELAAQLGIRLIPTQLFFSPDGKVLARHEGFLSKEDIVNAFGQLGYPLTKSTTPSHEGATDSTSP